MRLILYVFALVGILTSAMIISCDTDTTIHDTLIQAETSIDAAPDSVFSLLTGIAGKMDDASKEDRILYELLLLKANANNDILPNSDTTIVNLSNYYLRSTDSLRMAESLYLAGRTYNEMLYNSTAITCFERALQLFPSEPWNATEWHLRGLIYTAMATTYLKLRNQPYAIKLYHNAIMCEKKADNKKGIITNLSLLSSIPGVPGSAIKYASEGLALSKSINDSLRSAKLHLQLALCFCINNDLDTALSLLESGKKMITPKFNDFPQLYVTAGWIYFNAGMRDSSILYFEKLLQCGSMGEKQTACRYLSKLSVDTRDTLDSLIKIAEAVDFLEIKRPPNHFYQIDLIGKNNPTTLQTASPYDYVWKALLALIFVCLALALYSYSQHRIRKRSIQNSVLPEFKHYLYTSPAVNEAHQMAAEGKVLPKEQIDSLIAELDIVFAGFRETLSRHILLNPTQYSVSIMTKAGFQPTEIATLLSLSTSTISSMRGRLFQKAFGGQASSAKWDEFIMGL